MSFDCIPLDHGTPYEYFTANLTIKYDNCEALEGINGESSWNCMTKRLLMIETSLGIRYQSWIAVIRSTRKSNVGKLMNVLEVSGSILYFIL
jgi:hypothetical protein